jgi:hypothetical protein
LSWLLHVVEETFGVCDIVETERLFDTGFRTI